jgi:hypothetical protein
MGASWRGGLSGVSLKEGEMAKSVHTAKEHAEKMCALACCPHDLPLKKIKSLVKEAKYICKACARVAADKKNLCQPELIA